MKVWLAVKKMSVSTLAAFVLLSSFSLSVWAAEESEPAGAVIYVAPSGSDNGNGSKEQPFGTIERAKQAAREMKTSVEGDMHIVLRGGTYPVREPILSTGRI